ncbi:abortive infection family protein [Flavobacterium sp. RHBU_3]|uniref:abortive infection family protein n=1 Tax=Flavobacterium sp. RHBU_3 TaxID=3391184 RepID=UPI00398466BE
MNNKITEITRRNIFDYIQVENIYWAGRISEIDFLSRMFNLELIPSLDTRFVNAAEDIWQHRINNPYDWPDNWIFYDDRFNLLRCEDSYFLNFLCETVHPIVRPDMAEVSKLIQIYNNNLRLDNYEIVEKTNISGRPIFMGRLAIVGNQIYTKRAHEIREIFNADYVTQQINQMETSIEVAPHISIGLAKELIETCCKSILQELGLEYDKNWDLIKLMKETTKLLKLTPDNIPNEVKAAASIKQILGSLSSVVHGIAEVRNEYGSGHGKDSKFIGLQPRHAKLAVGAASTLAIYLLETYQLKNKK